MESDIKYRFALDDTGKSTDVRSLRSRENIAGRTFQCLACGEPMIARLGLDVTHHFAHKPNNTCSGETYLHRLAKQVFLEEYTSCVASNRPFTIEPLQRQVCNQHPGYSETSCRTKIRPKPHDLTRFLPAIRVEREKNEFVPDITLESARGRHHVFLEIAVSHPCSAAKLRSKNKIMEINVSSEDDLQPIHDHLLSAHNPKITFHNFKQDIPADMCSWFTYCRLRKEVFILFKDGTSGVRYLDKDKEIPTQDLERADWYRESFVDMREEPSDWAQALAKIDSASRECAYDALQDGYVIRNCHFCDKFDYWGTSDCRKFKERVESTRAANCAFFSLVDFDALSAILSDC
jgi:hypothetical protein